MGEAQTSLSERRSSGDANESLAEVATRQHVDEGAWGRLEPLRDVFPVADLARRYQGDKLLQEGLVVLGRKLAAYESLDPQAASKNGEHRLRGGRLFGWFRVIVV